MEPVLQQFKVFIRGYMCLVTSATNTLTHCTYRQQINLKVIFLCFTTPTFITFWHCGAKAPIKSCGAYMTSHFKA